MYFTKMANIRKGTCRTKYGDEICCSGYYIFNGTCRECRIGTYRFLEDNESECITCNLGHYGRFCAFSCNCYFDSCSPVDGSCLYTTTDAGSLEKGQSSTPMIAGLFTGLCLLIFVISVSTIIITRKKRSGNSNIIRNTEMSNLPVNNEADYDYIDESLLNDNNPRQVSIQNSPNDLYSTSAVNSYGMDCDGYLNPYNALSDDWKKHTHVYNDGEDNRLPEQNDGYLQPYQPLTTNWQQQTHVYNDVEESKTICSGTNLSHV